MTAVCVEQSVSWFRLPVRTEVARRMSVVIAFQLVAHGQHRSVHVVLVIEHHDMTRSSKRDDQFPQEGALPGLALAER